MDRRWHLTLVFAWQGFEIAVIPTGALALLIGVAPSIAGVLAIVYGMKVEFGSCSAGETREPC